MKDKILRIVVNPHGVLVDVKLFDFSMEASGLLYYGTERHQRLYTDGVYRLGEIHKHKYYIGTYDACFVYVDYLGGKTEENIRDKVAEMIVLCKPILDKGIVSHKGMLSGLRRSRNRLEKEIKIVVPKLD